MVREKKGNYTFCSFTQLYSCSKSESKSRGRDALPEPGPRGAHLELALPSGGMRSFLLDPAVRCTAQDAVEKTWWQSNHLVAFLSGKKRTDRDACSEVLGSSGSVWGTQVYKKKMAEDSPPRGRSSPQGAEAGNGVDEAS